MDAKIIRGNILGAPISGTYININNADVGVLLGAAAGLAKTLFIAGAAIGIVSALLNIYANMETVEETEEEKMKRKEEKEKERFVTWGTLVQVESWYPYKGFIKKINRKFRGTCLNETISITCDSHDLTIPVNLIRGYERFSAKLHANFWGKINSYPDHETQIKLFDGSVYRGKIKSPDKFDFLTPVGEQSILIHDFLTEHSIRSNIVRDVEQLKVNIIHFINENHKKLEDYIGRENLEQFFRD